MERVRKASLWFACEYDDPIYCLFMPRLLSHSHKPYLLTYLLTYLLFGFRWGNPNEKKYHQYMMEYSPINNVREGVKYPSCLLTGGLHDPRVQVRTAILFMYLMVQ